MKGTRRLGEKVISNDLIGQDSNYRILREPIGVFPQGDEVIYSDSYLHQLDRLYPLHEVLGVRMIRCLQEGQGNGLAKFLADSPMQNEGGKEVLCYVLRNSAQAGLWQPFIIDGRRSNREVEYLGGHNFEKVNHPRFDKGKRSTPNGLLSGAAAAERYQFVLPVYHDSNVLFIPSQRFAEYCLGKGNYPKNFH